jgi:hypothetical protein
MTKPTKPTKPTKRKYLTARQALLKVAKNFEEMSEGNSYGLLECDYVCWQIQRLNDIDDGGEPLISKETERKILTYIRSALGDTAFVTNWLRENSEEYRQWEARQFCESEQLRGWNLYRAAWCRQMAMEVF